MADDPTPTDGPTASPLAAQIRLDDLIDAIKRVHQDPLEQLMDAAIAAEHLGDVADHLLGHFVDQARRAGASWADIGRSMGVTKQAVQKRFVPRAGDLVDPEAGFERFTPRAQKVVMAAHAEAVAAGSDHVGVPHLVLGLLSEREALAAATIRALGVELPAIREAATAALPAPVEDPPSVVPYDTEARKVLELTFREALRLGHNYVGTEHLLLALLEHEGDHGLLTDLGLGKVAAGAEIVRVLSTLQGS